MDGRWTVENQGRSAQAASQAVQLRTPVGAGSSFFPSDVRVAGAFLHVCARAPPISAIHRGRG
jgi:hypothetical protein